MWFSNYISFLLSYLSSWYAGLLRFYCVLYFRILERKSRKLEKRLTKFYMVQSKLLNSFMKQLVIVESYLFKVENCIIRSLVNSVSGNISTRVWLGMKKQRYLSKPKDGKVQGVHESMP